MRAFYYPRIVRSEPSQTELEGDETVLITTHLIDEIENVIDRAIILHQGTIKADIYIDDMREQGKSLADVMLEIRNVKPSSPIYFPFDE